MTTLHPDDPSLRDPEFKKAYLDGWHRSSNPNEHWDTKHPRIWANALHEYRRQLSHGHGVPKLDVDDYQPLLRGFVNLVRAAIRNGSKRDLTALWLAFTHTVREESGGEEIDAHGLLRLDTVSSYMAWRWHVAFLDENHVGIAPSNDIRSHVGATYLLRLYESTGVGAMTFIEGMATLADGRRYNVWDKFWKRTRKGGRIETPFFNDTTDAALGALVELSPRKGLSKADLEALRVYVSAFNGQSFASASPSDLRYLRDALDHGRFFATGQELVLDSIEHQLVNLYGLSPRAGRRGYRAHPFAYRTLTPKSVDAMCKKAVGLSALAWMAFSEFYFVLREKQSLRTSTAPNVDMLAAAHQTLAALRMPGEEKRRLRDARLRELRRLRQRVQVTSRVDESP